MSQAHMSHWAAFTVLVVGAFKTCVLFCQVRTLVFKSHFVIQAELQRPHQPLKYERLNNYYMMLPRGIVPLE